MQTCGTTLISYAHEDRAYAESLAAQLKSLGEAVWLDKEIEPGARWDRVVGDQLASCERVIVLLSPEAVASENVLDEVGYALDRGRPVVPVLLRDCEIPLRLKRVQYIDARANPDPLRTVRRLRHSAPPAGLTAMLATSITLLTSAVVLTILAGLYFKLEGMPLDAPAYAVVAIASFCTVIALQVVRRRLRVWKG